MRILLVDDEEQILKGVQRLISCEEEDWEVEVALSAEEALQLLDDKTFEVVVTDMRMPGMDGAEFLDVVEHKYPSMLRVILSGQADRDAVMRAVKPMHQYLTKPCDPDQLMEAINRANIFQQTIKDPELLEAMGHANCLPSFPEIVRQIDRETKSDSGDAKAVASIIEKDPVLCAKLLQVTNSAIFALSTPVLDVDHAVSIAGLDIVRALAMAQAVFKSDGNSQQVRLAKSLMDHGLSVALKAREIAKHLQMPSEQCNAVYTAGLLHDVGKLLLLNAFPEKYNQVKLTEGAACPLTDQQSEMEIFGATHQGVGGYLFELWGLPAEVINAVASHHSFLHCAKATGQSSQVVFAANWIDHAHDAGKLDQLKCLANGCPESETFANQIQQWSQLINEKDAQETVQ